MVVVQALSQLPVKLEAHVVLRADIIQGVEFGLQLGGLAVESGKNGSEGADGKRIGDDSNDHKTNAEYSLSESACTHVAISHCGDGGDREVEANQIQVLRRLVLVAIGHDPAIQRHSIQFINQKPQTGSHMAENQENQGEDNNSLH